MLTKLVCFNWICKLPNKIIYLWFLCITVNIIIIALLYTYYVNQTFRCVCE